ncbi:FHA domain-containing protein [Thermoactinospora rubra]|uniref:FHA domain-containing protein n=1 Tax=Thermoactinospora rubra TaxID=1088767 RepID=UPI000A11681C|nr:FHA domain-containing protein [Thermoactinospora rubra]
MTATSSCPQGHTSADPDYCDVCGAQIGGQPGASAQASPESAAASAGAPATGPAACPVCQTPLTGQYCEVCGHDSTAPVVEPPPVTAWEAVVAADRAYFEQVIAEGGPDAGAVVFPPYCPERSYALSGPQVRIGRGSRSRGTKPEIDLGEPPPDPGVSHLHAVLLAQPDGTWTLVDPGSSNGTRLNGKPLQVNVPVPIRDGDRVHLGAWTVITIRGSAP